MFLNLEYVSEVIIINKTIIKSDIFIELLVL